MEKVDSAIRECVSSAWVSIMINDTPKGFFSAERVLRQGDPLSAFLFLVVGEVLGRMLKAAVDAGLFTRFKVETLLQLVISSLLMTPSSSVGKMKTG